MVDRATDSGLGGGIASKAAAVVSQAVVATKAGMAGHHVSLARMIQEDFFGITGAELRSTMGPLYRSLATSTELHPAVKATLQFVGNGKGQFATMLGNGITGAAMAGGLGLVLTNYLQPAVGRTVADAPNLPISVADAVNARLRGFITEEQANFEIRSQGIGDQRQSWLTELSRQRHSPQELQDLLNRGVVDEAFAVAQMGKLGFDSAVAERVLGLRRVLHSAQALADLVTFGVLSESEAAGKAEQSGMTRDDFHLLVLGNGQPPATGDLLEAYRRGLIDKRRLEHGIEQGPVRNEWFDMIEALRFSPMSPSDAIEAFVQGHLTEAQSRQIAQEGGLQPDHWQPLMETAGTPPGVQLMIDAWQRGLMTRDELVAGIKESRLKNKYIDLVISAGETLPDQGTIRTLLKNNVITNERGLDLLLKRGYAQDLAQAFVEDAHHEKTSDSRGLTGSQIVSLYEVRAITRDEAAAMMDAISYDPDAAGQLLDLADIRHTKKFVDQAVTRVRAGYLAGRVDENTVAAQLDALRVAPDERDDLLALWDLEKAVPSKQVTEAQLRAAAKAGIITWQGYYEKLIGYGYAEDDAFILVQLYGPRG